MIWQVIASRCCENDQEKGQNVEMKKKKKKKKKKKRKQEENLKNVWEVSPAHRPQDFPNIVFLGLQFFCSECRVLANGAFACSRLIVFLVRVWRFGEEGRSGGEWRSREE